MKTRKIQYIIYAILITTAIIGGILILSKNSDSKFRQQMELGTKALLNMDYEASIAAFSNAIDLNPKAVDAYLGLTKSYIGLDDYANAASSLTKGYYTVPAPTILSLLDSIDVKRLIALGNALLSKGEANLAKDAFEEALKKEAVNEEAEKGLEDATNHPSYDPIDDVNSDNSNDSTQDAILADNNQEQTNSNDHKTDTHPLNFQPSDITFFGYPVTENHYEEWKSALNFSGDDTDPTYGGDDNSSFCNKLICGNGTFADQGSLLKISLIDTNGMVAFLNWDAQGTNYLFNISSNDTWNHITSQHVSGPFYIGQSFDEALQATGYIGEISFDGTPVTISDKITVIGTSHNGTDTVMFMFDQMTQVQFSGSGNVIRQIVVRAPAN